MGKSDKIGLVLATYGSLPHCHLGLESFRCYCTGQFCLLHDDCSEQSIDLLNLANDYGVDFQTTNNRLGHGAGDACAICSGLIWAANHNLTWLIKCSRRFIPVFHYYLEENSKINTYATRDNYWGLQFSTEFFYMRVSYWLQKIPLLRNFIDKQPTDYFLEHLLEKEPFTRIDWKIENRSEHSYNYYWHNFSGIKDYFKLSTYWFDNLYAEKDFCGVVEN